MKTVADYLRNTPKGTKLYSPICGECTLMTVSNNRIVVMDHRNVCRSFDPYGLIDVNGECLLFPSKEVRDWSNYQLPAPYDFKPFDKVVVRDEGTWHIDFFERYDLSNKEFPYQCMTSNWKHCLPFNEETAKLISTKDGGACAG